TWNAKPLSCGRARRSVRVRVGSERSRVAFVEPDEHDASCLAPSVVPTTHCSLHVTHLPCAESNQIHYLGGVTSSRARGIAREEPRRRVSSCGGTVPGARKRAFSHSRRASSSSALFSHPYSASRLRPRPRARLRASTCSSPRAATPSC